MHAKCATEINGDLRWICESWLCDMVASGARACVLASSGVRDLGVAVAAGVRDLVDESWCCLSV